MQTFINTGTLRILYLLVLSVALFLLDDARFIGACLLLQAGLWIYSRLSPALLLHSIRRLLFFFTIILISYALLPLGADTAGHIRTISTRLFSFDIHLDGLQLALVMCLRVLTIILASIWVQQGMTATQFVAALRQLHVPALLALAIDTTLDQLGGGKPGGRGSGSGTGGGKGGGKGGAGRQRLSLAFAQIRRGDLSFIQQMIDRSFANAGQRISERHPHLPVKQARDLAVIVGVAVTIMGLKVIQILPGLPVAPGHKNLLMVPLFLLAAHLTSLRLGGFWTGMTVGVINFMLGYGKYGLLEIGQFALPGLLADLLLPLVGGRSRWLRLLQFALIGALLGLARFSANLLVIILAGAPPAAFFIYLPMLFSQVVFGSVSALVCVILINPARKERDMGSANETAQNSNQSPPTT